MMENQDYIYFKSYVDTLPLSLDKKEQEMLFYTYSKTKDENIKQKLIEHNLRLCSSFALKYCDSHNKIKDIFDVNSECIVELAKAIDDFDVTKGYAFITFAYKCMENHMARVYNKQKRDALNFVGEEINVNDENDKKDIFCTLFDESESNIAEDVGEEEFVKDVISFMENYPHSEIIKMYYNVDVDEKYFQSYIVSKFNITYYKVTKILTQFKKDLKVYIRQSYPQVYEKIKDEEKSVLRFKTVQERDEYIIKSYYGIGLKKKSDKELAEECGLLCGYAKIIASNYKKSLPKEERKKLNRSYKTPTDIDSVSDGETNLLQE